LSTEATLAFTVFDLSTGENSSVSKELANVDFVLVSSLGIIEANEAHLVSKLLTEETAQLLLLDFFVLTLALFELGTE